MHRLPQGHPGDGVHGSIGELQTIMSNEYFTGSSPYCKPVKWSRIDYVEDVGFIMSVSDHPIAFLLYMVIGLILYRLDA
jgi:hypothetical protein